MYVCMCIGIYVCMSWGIRSSSGGESSVTWRVRLCMYVGESSVTWLRPELFFSSNPDPEGQPTLLYLLDGDGHDAVRYAYTPPTYIHTYSPFTSHSYTLTIHTCIHTFIHTCIHTCIGRGSVWAMAAGIIHTHIMICGERIYKILYEGDK
jgi:hypothetical protein